MRDWRIKALGRRQDGKLTDSQDSFNFSFVEVHPRKENFSISATFEVEDASGANYQSGFGIMAVDTVASASYLSRHRNSLMVGCFRASFGSAYSYGVRVVGGYTDRDAMPQDGRRRYDTSRLFPFAGSFDRIREGERKVLKLEKTNDGFIASMRTDSGEEAIFFPGCDFLLKQERRSIYVGFAVAGDLKINVSGVRFNRGPGKKSHTPDGTIKRSVPDYPFNRNLVDSLKPYFTDVAPGGEIILPDGVYNAGTFYIGRNQSGVADNPIILRAEHPGKVILDGSSSQDKLPAMILHGSYWILDGLVFRNAPSCGLFICGSDNIVRNCEAYGNGDTGFLICSFPGSPEKDWPARNRIESCVSHDNCDEVCCNADGFGAKLSIGEGNGFFNCKSYHNIDDGFDLYTKSSIGKIGAVIIEDCVAESNGWLSDEPRPSEDPKTGVGFKLGGEGQGVRHQVRGCVANDNALAGFHANSNPEVFLFDCKATGNGIDFKMPSKPDAELSRGTIARVSDWYHRIRKRTRLFLNRIFSSGGTQQAILQKFTLIIPGIASYSRSQVLYQLCRQALIKGCGSLQEYYDKVSSDPESLSQLKVNLTFSGSHFFRGDVWPKLREVCSESFRNRDMVRVWCAGCANGKEVYSLLMVLLDFLPSDKIDLLATDYNPEQLLKCEEGIYPLSTLKEIPAEYKRYSVTLNRDQFQISSDLRRIVKTKCQNLVSDEYPAGFDLILCRNVTKFFEKDVRRKVQEILAASLKDGGYLVVSDDLLREGIADPGSMSLIQQGDTCIYRKNLSNEKRQF
ncbi:MAG: right-handed parallel beta-helix repeat-containing protein [Bacteroidales bacterium]|nr:right-handed parallel beta-helix repeat-containing protein [Bacteroidales bacterium]